MHRVYSTPAPSVSAKRVCSSLYAKKSLIPVIGMVKLMNASRNFHLQPDAQQADSAPDCNLASMQLTSTSFWMQIETLARLPWCISVVDFCSFMGESNSQQPAECPKIPMQGRSYNPPAPYLTTHQLLTSNAFSESCMIWGAQSSLIACTRLPSLLGVCCLDKLPNMGLAMSSHIYCDLFI